MSLSSQYLEELSRRYKKQVEDLQQTLTQQTQTVRQLEEQTRRHMEFEQIMSQRYTQLRNELNEMSLQVHACIVVIIFVGVIAFLVLMVGILFYRSLQRKLKEVVTSKQSPIAQANKRKSSPNQRKLNRRKSFDDVAEQQQSRSKGDSLNIEKVRRPSEEVMLILKESGDCSNQLSSNSSLRQRKISVCYGSNKNLNAEENENGVAFTQKVGKSSKRKGEKQSWPNTSHSQQQAWQRLELLQAEKEMAEAERSGK